MSFKPIITDAGLAAALDAQQNQVKVVISHVALGDQGYTPETSATALKSEQARSALAGEQLSPHQIHLSATLNTGEFWVKEIGFYTDAGVLFAIWSHETHPFAYKAASVDLVLALDLVVTSLPADLLEVKGGDFSLPIATEQKRGIVELATTEEATAGTDAAVVITAKTLKEQTSPIAADLAALKEQSAKAAHIASGVFDVARIPDLDASRITTGTLDPQRLPGVVSSGHYDSNRFYPTCTYHWFYDQGSETKGAYYECYHPDGVKGHSPHDAQPMGFSTPFFWVKKDYFHKPGTIIALPVEWSRELGLLPCAGAEVSILRYWRLVKRGKLVNVNPLTEPRPSLYERAFINSYGILRRLGTMKLPEVISTGTLIEESGPQYNEIQFGHIPQMRGSLYASGGGGGVKNPFRHAADGGEYQGAEWKYQAMPYRRVNFDTSVFDFVSTTSRAVSPAGFQVAFCIVI